MGKEFIVVSTGAKSISELKFKEVERRGKTPIFDYSAVISVLNSGKAYVLDKEVKEQTARSAIKKIKESLNKGLAVKVRKIEGTEHTIKVKDKDTVVYQLAFVPVKD